MAKSKHFGALAAAAGALVAVALLVVMLVLVKPQPAGAAFQGRPGPIAFSRWDGNDYEIHFKIFLPEVSLSRQVTDNDTNDRWPCASPDGERIVYSHWDGNDWEIYTQTPHAKWPLPKPDPVTNNNKDDADPCYAATDGSMIAYGASDGNDLEIYTINANGVGSPFNVTNNNRNDGSPSYTKENGHEIAYHGHDGNDWEIYTINRSGLGTGRQVTDNDTNDLFPDYQPSGYSILYQCQPPLEGEDSEICRVGRYGTWKRVLTNNTREDKYPVFSPALGSFAYSSDDGNDYEIYVKDLLGEVIFPYTTNDINDLEPSWEPRRTLPALQPLPIDVPESPGLGSHSSTR